MNPILLLVLLIILLYILKPLISQSKYCARCGSTELEEVFGVYVCTKCGYFKV